MPDRFAAEALNFDAPAYQLEAAVYDTNFVDLPRALWVGAAGNISILTVKGTSEVLPGVTAGSLLPVRAVRINTSGTTVPAGNIVGLS